MKYLTNTDYIEFDHDIDQIVTSTGEIRTVDIFIPTRVFDDFETIIDCFEQYDDSRVDAHSKDYYIAYYGDHESRNVVRICLLGAPKFFDMMHKQHWKHYFDVMDTYITEYLTLK